MDLKEMKKTKSMPILYLAELQLQQQNIIFNYCLHQNFALHELLKVKKKTSNGSVCPVRVLLDQVK